MNSVELRAQMMAIWARMKEINDRAEAESRGLTAEEDAAWTTAKDEFMALRGRIERQEYLESVPASDEERLAWQLRRDAAAGPPASQEDAEARGKRAYRAAFREYISCRSRAQIRAESWETLFSGVHQFTDTEHKTLQDILTPTQYRAARSVASQTGGGFWVPEDMMQRVEKALLWYGGMRQFAEVITTDDGGDLPFPVYDDTANVGRRLAENTAATQTDLAVAVRVFKAHVYTSDEVLVSQALRPDRPDLATDVLADARGGSALFLNGLVGRQLYITSYAMQSRRGTMSGQFADGTGGTTHLTLRWSLPVHSGAFAQAAGPPGSLFHTSAGNGLYFWTTGDGVVDVDVSFWDE